MMNNSYRLNNAKDMIDLAQFIQSMVYWDKYFYLNDDEHIPYYQFWNYCYSAVDQGCDLVEINEKDDDVKFMKFFPSSRREN